MESVTQKQKSQLYNIKQFVESSSKIKSQLRFSISSKEKSPTKKNYWIHGKIKNVSLSDRILYIDIYSDLESTYQISFTDIEVLELLENYENCNIKITDLIIYSDNTNTKLLTTDKTKYYLDSYNENIEQEIQFDFDKYLKIPVESKFIDKNTEIKGIINSKFRAIIYFRKVFEKKNLIIFKLYSLINSNNATLHVFLKPTDNIKLILLKFDLGSLIFVNKGKFRFSFDKKTIYFESIAKDLDLIRNLNYIEKLKINKFRSANLNEIKFLCDLDNNILDRTLSKYVLTIDSINKIRVKYNKNYAYSEFQRFPNLHMNVSIQANDRINTCNLTISGEILQNFLGLTDLDIKLIYEKSLIESNFEFYPNEFKIKNFINDEYIVYGKPIMGINKNIDHEGFINGDLFYIQNNHNNIRHQVRLEVLHIQKLDWSRNSCF